LYHGGEEGLEHAILIFRDLIGRYGATSFLLNNMASAYMQMDNYEAAEQALLEALEKDPRSGDTRVNLVVCYQHMKLQDKVRTNLNHLRVNNQNHPWITELERREEQFLSLTTKYLP